MILLLTLMVVSNPANILTVLPLAVLPIKTFSFFIVFTINIRMLLMLCGSADYTPDVIRPDTAQ